MSEKETPETPEEQEQPKPAEQQFTIQKIYLKDTSFECPNSPQIFTEKWEPNINIELNSNTKLISDNVNEVVLGVTVTAKLGEQVAFLIEVAQAGIFTIIGFPEKELSGMLGSYCPNLLYPYAREAISDIVTKGGYPQLLLAPVNFDAIYQDHLKQQKQALTDKQGAESIH